MTCQGQVREGGGASIGKQIFCIYNQPSLGLSNTALLGILARKWVWIPKFETSVVCSGVCSHILAKTTSSLFLFLGYVLQCNSYLHSSGPNIKPLVPFLVISFCSSIFLTAVFLVLHFSFSHFIFISLGLVIIPTGSLGDIRHPILKDDTDFSRGDISF